MHNVVGIDIGSTYTKAIALRRGEARVVGTAVRRTGFKLAVAAESVFEDLLITAPWRARTSSMLPPPATDAIRYRFATRRSPN